jgi:hypothetical protein
LHEDHDAEQSSPLARGGILTVERADEVCFSLKSCVSAVMRRRMPAANEALVSIKHRFTGVDRKA